jgi:peptidoglycan/LPS O-acetylase OafA/YrhL
MANTTGAATRFATLIVLVVGAGSLSWYGFERPLIRWGRSRFPSQA